MKTKKVGDPYLFENILIKILFIVYFTASLHGNLPFQQLNVSTFWNLVTIFGIAIRRMHAKVQTCLVFV